MITVELRSASVECHISNLLNATKAGGSDSEPSFQVPDSIEPAKTEKEEESVSQTCDLPATNV